MLDQAPPPANRGNNEKDAMADITDLPRPLAFVLSGGSNLGAIQVGMLRGLHRAGIEPDLVIGSSVGAMNGAMIAADPADGADRLTDVWLSLGRLLNPSSTVSSDLLDFIARHLKHLFALYCRSRIVDMHNGFFSAD